MMLLKEVVRRNNNAAFYSDVQLSSYRGPENLELAKSFIFIGKTAGSRRASLDLLGQVCNAYLPGNQPNRYTFIATYGHGKSHFALAIANYFGRTSESPEVVAILENIRHSAGDEALYGTFADFKRHHRPLLVITLRGDDPGDLQSQFYRALDDAIQDNEESRSAELPFWFGAADRFLQNIRPESVAAAEGYLAARQMDLGLLLEKVKRRESTARTVCRELHQHLYNSTPNFGTATSLREAIEWVTDNLCGPTKGLGGVLVLFDEFSAFVRDYAVAGHSTAGTPLQDLLNGIANRPGRAAFVAFAQHDPDTVANTVLRGAPEHLASLKHELSRLPMPQRLVLYSSLEQVLDAYLQQDETAWETLLRDPSFGQAVFESTDATLTAFDARYREEMHWSKPHFQEVVTLGCFPLSPMTTALLASVDLQSTSSPRSVLGFVIQSLNDGGDEPVIVDGRPRWIAPYALVDYFGTMLGDDPWRDYSDALRQAGGPDAPELERRVLQAMLLQVAGQVPTRAVGFERMAANLADTAVNEASAALKGLRDRGVIRSDEVQKIYTFWPAGRSASELEKRIAEKTAGRSLDRDSLDRLEPYLRAQGALAPLAVSVNWGHPEDWQAEQVLVTRDMVRGTPLKALIKDRLWSTPLKEERARGLVLWPIADTAEDVEWYRAGVTAALDNQCGDEPVAVAVMVPREPSPQLVRLLLRRSALHAMSNAELLAVGKEQWDDLSNRELALLKTEVGRLGARSGHQVVKAVRARIRVVQPTSLSALLGELYTMVYGLVPGPFFTQYKCAQTKLASAVAAVYIHLAEDSAGTPGLYDANRVALDIIEMFLVSHWGILERGNHRVRRPATGSKAVAAWEVLEKYFAKDSVARSAADVLTTLLNAPYGLDVNTCALLASAWCGYYRHDLSFTDGPRRIAIQDVAKDPRRGVKNPREFIASLSTVCVARRDLTDVANEIAALVARTQGGVFSAAEAADAVRQLQAFVADERNEAHLIAEAGSAAARLTADSEVARDYDGKVQRLIDSSSSDNVIQQCNLLAYVQKLPAIGIVKPQRPAIEEVRNQLMRRITTATERKCADLEKLNDLTEYELNKQVLLSIIRALNAAQLEGLANRARGAVTNLETARRQLDDRAGDAAALAAMKALPNRGPLIEMRLAATELGSLSLRTDDAKRQAAEKLKAVADEIRRLEALSRGLRERVDGCRDAVALRQIRDSIIREQDLFRDTGEGELVTEALKQCERVREYLSQVSAVEGHQSRSPRELEQQLAKAREVLGRYEEFLSPSQRETAHAVVDRLERIGERHRADAMSWLKEREADADGEEAEPVTLMAMLDSPPPFLPSDAMARLEELRCRVSNRIDEDQVLLTEQHFVRIADIDKRRGCIRRLQTLVEQPENVG
jgi:hypothetical protein